MWRTVGVLVWKNWRVKQRESRFNRGRSSKQWLFPALVTDIVIPLGLLLVLIQTMCQYNAMLLPSGQTNLFDLEGLDGLDLNGTDFGLPSFERVLMTSADDAIMDPISDQKKTEHATVLMTALPLLLAKSNQSLAILDRPNSVLFLQYLDRQYPAAKELGIASYMELTKIIPFDETLSNDEADKILLAYPQESGFPIYAGLDIRQTTNEKEEEEEDAENGRQRARPLELLTLLYEKVLQDPSQEDSDDQVTRYFYKDVASSEGSLNFPNFLPFQMALNLFLRENLTFKKDNIQPKRISLRSIPAEFICLMVNKMLSITGLPWETFPMTSPLGHNLTSCQSAVSKGNFSTETETFIETFLTNALSGDELRTLIVSALPRRPANSISGSLEGNIVFYITYLFMWPYMRLIRDVVGEKEKQLKEYLMIMGIPAMALLLSWFLLYLMASSAVALLATFLLRDNMFAATTEGNISFFLLLLAFVSSMLLFGICITPIFNQTKTATACAPLVFFVLSAGSFLRSLVGDDTVASSPLWALLLTILDGISSPVVFMKAIHGILAFDAVTNALRPITWLTVAQPCRLMAIQCTGYLVLGWYLENVFPRTYGVQQKWYFLFQPSYWFPQPFDAHSLAEDRDESMGITTNINEPMDDTIREQSLSDYLKACRPSLFLRALSKTYPNGKVALQNVSFGVRKGEIFGLLGPNGAGKSTTLAILSGMLAPTTGDAFIGGSISVASNPRAVRQSLSVCFQQNILYESLTVWEHLVLVCALKQSMGIPTVSEATYSKKLELFQLDEKKEALSKTLSGGQKRKLSLVLALLDSSRVLLLDEPTAGMDLKARLDTWDALKRAVTHRAVILTTHSMQEAEALCENIGIVANGTLQCCGSSLFLRTKYGVGYKLTVVYSGDETEEEKNRDFRQKKVHDQLLSLVTQYVPNAMILSNNKWETRLQLTEGNEHEFATMFRELDKLKATGAIKRYAIAATDLEDVFVKVTEGQDVYYHVKDEVQTNGDSLDTLWSKKTDPIQSKSTPNRHKSPPMHTTLSLWTRIALSPLYALLYKRILISFRDKKGLFAQYVWPLGFFTIFMIVVQRVLTASGTIQDMTTVPLSFRDASFYLSSSLDARDAVQDLLTPFETFRGSHAIIVDTKANTEEEMLEAILQDTETTYFGAVFVENVTWTTNLSPVMTYQLYYNETVRHSLPVTLQWITQAYCLARVTKDATAVEQATCTVHVKQGTFPIDPDSALGVRTNDDDSVEINFDEAMDVMRRIMVAFYLLMSMSTIVGHYAAPIVSEKGSGLKRLQYQHLEARHASILYWLSNFLYDYCMYALASGTMCTILVLSSASLSMTIIAAWGVSMIFFGLAILPAQYLTSLVFSSHSSAQSYMSYVSMFQTLAASVVFALSMVPGLCVEVNRLTYFLQVLPLYTFSIAVLNIVTVSWTPMRQQCQQVGNLDSADFLTILEGFTTPTTSPPSVWSWDVAANSWAALVLSGIGYTVLLLAVDQYQMYPTEVKYKVRQVFERQIGRWRYGQGEYTHVDRTNPVVQDEEESPSTNAMVHVTHVSKIYNPRPTRSNTGSHQVVALENVTFAVEKRDCVALLGVNGSGKSTMFEILTAGTFPTSGKATIDATDVTLAPRETSAKYGYCPQTNMFFNDLSVRDHLVLFSRLRNNANFLYEQALFDTLLERLDLRRVEQTAAKHLSGGNKRRLMLALALVSDHSSLLLLDEPSAGVDVVARRLMWRVLHEKQQTGNATSCLFTTHSMEEAEAVCANAVVLFRGQIVWCGSIPDLKQRVARGVSISVRLDRTKICTSELVDRYLKALTNATPGLKRKGVALHELEETWEVCQHVLYDQSETEARERSREYGKLWLSGLRARFCTTEKDKEEISRLEFVQEWLVVEAFVRLEMDLFLKEVTKRSGEPVVSADGERAGRSGHQMSCTYETSLNDAFGLADLFALLEENKADFQILQYSISELSLERVFEQFT